MSRPQWITETAEGKLPITASTVLHKRLRFINKPSLVIYIKSPSLDHKRPNPFLLSFSPSFWPNTSSTHNIAQQAWPNMCDWEEFIFGCQCTYTKRKNYCHFARNDPNHQCFGVQVLKKVWDVPEACDKCCSSRAAMQASTSGWGHQYVAHGSGE